MAERTMTQPNNEFPKGREASEVLDELGEDFVGGNPYVGYAGALADYESRADIETLAERRSRVADSFGDGLDAAGVSTAQYTDPAPTTVTDAE